MKRHLISLKGRITAIPYIGLPALTQVKMGRQAFLSLARMTWADMKLPWKVSVRMERWENQTPTLR